MIKGFFFDLDGTLVDTHQANYESYKRALAEEGITLTFEDFKRIVGMQVDEFLPIVAPGLEPSRFERVKENKATHYKELTHLTKRNEALLNFLSYTKAGHTIGLVTTARRVNAEAVLLHHDLHKQFDFIITAEDVSNSKPSPEAYELALKKAGLAADEVIAFEDSESGKQSADAAHIAVVMITDFAL